MGHRPLLRSLCYPSFLCVLPLLKFTYVVDNDTTVHDVHTYTVAFSPSVLSLPADTDAHSVNGSRKRFTEKDTQSYYFITLVCFLCSFCWSMCSLCSSLCSLFVCFVVSLVFPMFSYVFFVFFLVVVLAFVLSHVFCVFSMCSLCYSVCSLFSLVFAVAPFCVPFILLCCLHKRRLDGQNHLSSVRNMGRRSQSTSPSLQRRRRKNHTAPKRKAQKSSSWSKGWKENPCWKPESTSHMKQIVQQHKNERVRVSQFVCPRLSCVPVNSLSGARGRWAPHARRTQQHHAGDAHVQLRNLTQSVTIKKMRKLCCSTQSKRRAKMK